MNTRTCLGALVALPGLVILAHCSSTERDCTDPIFADSLTCSAYKDGGTVDGGRTDGGEGGIIQPPDCDLTKAPKDSPACVDDGVGIFVSPTGSDGGSGTKAAPVKTIAKALAIAGPKRVYVCEGTYDEAVAIGAAASVYGGFSCAWTVTGARPKLAPSKGVALAVTKVTGAVVVQDLEIVGAADPGTPGDSAIAAFVSESTNVTFRNVVLTAKDGVAADTGAGRSNYAGAAKDGANASGATAGVATTCTCTDSTSSTGGAGASGAGAGLQDGSASPAVGGSNSGLTGLTTCTDGQVGANGAAGAVGAAPTTAGTLSASGWSSAATGPAAPNGKPAQGGGGGGAKTNASVAGGGGGCGGCGGAGGGAGNNGGSSFALLSFKSTVTVEGGALSTGTGGRGGDGAPGQAGQSGGAVGACSATSGASWAGGSAWSGWSRAPASGSSTGSCAMSRVYPRIRR